VPLRGKRLLVVDHDRDIIDLLAGAAAARRAVVSACRGGREALGELDAAGADGAVVDLPLPDVRAEAFLQALQVRGVPCVAVSGVLRGDWHARWAASFGVAAYFEKPFEAGEVLEALARTLERSHPLLAGGALAREHDSAVFPAARPALEEAIPGAPQRQALEGLAMPLPSPPGLTPCMPESPPSLIEGDLASVRVPRLLAETFAARLTGLLTLARGRASKVVLLDGGRPVFATSNDPQEQFGFRCVRTGTVSQAEIEALAGQPQESLADALLARGLLPPRRCAELVLEQVREVVWSTFSWRDGGYRVRASALARRPAVVLEIPVEDLVLDGIRRTATLERLRAELPPDLALGAGDGSAFDLKPPRLAPGEAAMLAAADGTKTAADLVALSGMAERDALAFLFACRELRLLVEVDRLLGGTRRIGFL
jgi:CheY-like chemotaxis protein